MRKIIEILFQLFNVSGFSFSKKTLERETHTNNEHPLQQFCGCL